MTVMEQIERRVSKSYEEKIAQALRKQQEEMDLRHKEALRKQPEEINREQVLLKRGYDPSDMAEILQLELVKVQSLATSP